MMYAGMRYAPPVYRDGQAAVGLGEVVTAPVVRVPSPWTLAVATSVIGAATGWVIEEVARHVRGRKRRR